MPKVLLKDVVARIKDKVDKDNTDLKYYIGGEHFDSGEIQITKKGIIKESTIGPAFHMRFQPGDVLLMSRNPHLRKAGIVDFEGICSDVSYVCRTKDENVLMQRFIPFIFQTDHFWKFAEENKKGSTNFFLNWSDFEKYEFELPQIDEQKKLCEMMWAFEDTKSAYKDLLLQTDKLVKSQFIEMFGERTTTPVGYYIKDSFPGDWGKEDLDGTGVKVIRTTNFTNFGKLNLSEVVTRSIEERKIQKKQILKYDTILERSGGTADNPVGRVVLFEEDEQYLCNNFTQVLRFKDIDPRFAFYALFYFYQMNKTSIRSMGSKTTGIQNLNMSKYLEIGIPNADEDEQKQFVSIAEQADKSKLVGHCSMNAMNVEISKLINKKISII